MAEGNEIGIRAVWDNKDFNAGQAAYVAKLGQANTATSAAQGGINQALAGGAFGFSSIGAQIGATAAIVTQAIGAVIGAAKAVWNFGQDALETASRVQQLNYVAQILGQKAGYTSSQINGIVESIRKQGIAAGAANNLVAQFLQANLDLAKASDLARVAQDSATLAGIGSSDALDKLIYGIQTQQIEVLRSAGITISAEQAYKDYAATLGVTAASLTQTQKKQVLLDAVLAEGARVAGAYEASMQTAGKQLGSLQSRIIPDFLNALGAPFQTAFYNAILGVNKFMSALTAAMSEGGKLYPILVNLGAAASIVAEGFAAMAQLVSDALTGVRSDIDNGLAAAIQNAYNWGVGLAVQFAQGIINGASSAITSAIGWVSNLISTWFQPHSPPLVASKIDEWGGETMNQYLSGFTKADFGMLEALQAPIKSAISALVSGGALGQDAGQELSRRLTEQMAAGLSGGGLGQEFFDTLASELGLYGAEIAELAKQQQALADAENNVKASEEALANARQRVSDTGAEINAQTIEYNRLLRSGASKEELDAQKAKIDAAREANQQAKKDEKQAESNLDTSKAQADALKEQLDLQKQLIQQLIELAQAQEKLKEPKLQTPEQTPGEIGGMGGVDVGDIADPMKDAIEEAKQKILESVNDMWNRIQVYFWMGVSYAKQALTWLAGEAGKKWNEIADYFGLPSWQQIQQAWLTATTWIIGQVRYMVDTLKGWWDEHGQSVQAVVSTLWGVVVTAFQIGTLAIIASVKLGLEFISGFWQRNQEAITGFVTLWWDNLKTIWENKLEIIGNVFDAFALLFQGNWAGAWGEVTRIFELEGENIKLVFESWWVGIKTYFGTASTEFQNNWGGFLGAVSGISTEIWNGITTFVTGKWTEIRNAFTDAYEGFKTNWSGFWGSVKTTANNTAEAIRSWVKQKWDATVKAITDTYETFKTNWSGFWEDVKEALDTAITNITTGIDTMFFGENGVQAKMKKGFEDALDAIGNTFTGFYDFGVDLMGKIIDGFLSQGGKLMEAIQDAISDALDAVGLGGFGGGDDGGNNGGGSTSTSTGGGGSGGGYELRANTSRPLRSALPSVTNSRVLNIQVVATVAPGGMTLPQLEGAIRKTTIRGLKGVA